MSEHLKTKDNILLCPVCGGDYLHMMQLILGTGEYKVEMVHGQTTIMHEKCTRPTIYRGAVIQLLIECEMCGVSTELNLRFHKGQIEVETCQSDTNSLPDIWRD